MVSQRFRQLRQRLLNRRQSALNKLHNLKSNLHKTTAPRKSPATKPQPRSTVYALLIGNEYVNYARSGRLDRLPGCHADVDAMKTVLNRIYRIPLNNIICMKEGTYSSMLTQMNQLVARQNATTIILYYSGHGTQVTDTNNDETDKHDECMVPCDFLEAGMITDDILAQQLFSKLSDTTKCILLSDSCNSGSLYDLPCMYSAVANPSHSGLKTGMAGKNIISISGCRDDQTSVSAYNLDRKTGWRGALTVAMEKTIRQKPTCTAEQFLLDVRIYLQRNQFHQKPQLCGTSTNLFTMRLLD